MVVPSGLAADQEAANRLARWGGRFLKPEKIEAVLESARQTVGVRVDEPTSTLIKRCAQQTLAAEAEIRQAQRRLEAFVEQDPRLEAEAQVVGKATACVLRVAVGDPRDYHCGEAYRKAIGLNLKERSSGKHQGKLKITKRGPSLARRWLYFAAMRTIQKAPVRSWYEAKRRKDKDRGNEALVAVMRKLALALHVVATRARPSRWSDCSPESPCPEPRPARRQNKQSGLKTVLLRKVYRLGQKRSKGATTSFAVAPLRFRTWLAHRVGPHRCPILQQADKRSTQSDQSNPRSFVTAVTRWLQA